MTKARKYTAYIATLVVSAILCGMGGLTGGEYAGLLKVALSVFVLGNGAEHYFDKKNS